jgi:putative SOS response-associated peptidase YedK
VDATASFEFREIKLLFNLQRDIPLLTPRFNIAPSQEVPVIVQNEGLNELKPMKWGLVPSWAPDPSIGNCVINARAETLTEKPSFKRLVQQRRCLIPADGFYEWRREGNREVPVWIHLKNKKPFAFAGLWDCWRDAEGQTLYTFTIITTLPNALLRPLHNRMPVMFDKLSAKQWLDPVFGPSDATLAAILAPYPSALMAVHDVSPVVNKPEYDQAECIVPASDAQGRLLQAAKRGAAMSSINKIKIIVLSCGHLFSRSGTSEPVVGEKDGKRTMLCPVCNKVQTI